MLKAALVVLLPILYITVSDLTFYTVTRYTVKYTVLATYSTSHFLTAQLL